MPIIPKLLHEIIAEQNATILTKADASDLTNYAPLNNVLALDNTTAFTPDADYEPATKKYVDDNGGGFTGTMDDIPDGTTYVKTENNFTDAAEAAVHTQNTDTNLGVLGAINPPVSGDKFLFRDVSNGDVIVTCTLAQLEAVINTYMQTYFAPLGPVININESAQYQNVDLKSPLDGGDYFLIEDANTEGKVFTTMADILAYVQANL